MKLPLLLCIIAIVISGTAALTCQDVFNPVPTETTESNSDVHSWFVLTPPGLKLGKSVGTKEYLGYHVAIRKLKKDNYTWKQWTTEETSRAYTVVRDEIEDVFRKHTVNNHKNNDPKVLQFYVQNSLENKFKSHNQELKSQVSGFSSQAYTFAYSHSKWLVSYNVDTGDGFLLMHSFTKTPFDPFPEEDHHYIFPTIGTDRQNIPQGSRTQFSQYMYCTSLSRKDMIDFMGVVEAVYPPIVFWNFDIKPALQKYPEATFVTSLQKVVLQGSEYKKTLIEEAENCYKKYHKATVNEITACSVHAPLKETPTSFFVGHRPLPRLYASGRGAAHKRSTKNPKEQEYPFTRLGPYPWNAVAAHAKEPLVVHHWNGYFKDKNDKKSGTAPLLNKRLVDPQGVKYSVLAMKTMKISVTLDDKTRLEEEWAGPRAHHKVAYSTQSNLVCVGDANHVVEQVHHGGIAFCFHSDNLKNAFSQWTTTDEDPKASLEDVKKRFEEVPYDTTNKNTKKAIGTLKMFLLPDLVTALTAEKESVAEAKTTIEKKAESPGQAFQAQAAISNNNNNIVNNNNIPTLTSTVTSTATDYSNLQKPLIIAAPPTPAKKAPVTMAKKSSAKKKAVTLIPGQQSITSFTTRKRSRSEMEGREQEPDHDDDNTPNKRQKTEQQEKKPK